MWQDRTARPDVFELRQREGYAAGYWAQNGSHDFGPV